MDLKWAAILGQFDLEGSVLVFKGRSVEYEGQLRPSIGNFICDRWFSGGQVGAEVEFEKIDAHAACEIILHFDPSVPAFVTAGLGGLRMYSIRDYAQGSSWTIHATAGDRENLRAGVRYAVKARLTGSQVHLSVDGVEVLSARLPFPLQQSQVGLWCMSEGDIRISGYQVDSVEPKVFAVMQYTSPYNEIYADVIQRICSEFGVKVVRADEAYGPGIIVADIARQITESLMIVAEITPSNPNVYYELGYAHAIGKPTILIAEKGTVLPFDVSPYRVLMYENTIPGKTAFETGLRKHMSAVLGFPASS